MQNGNKQYQPELSLGKPEQIVINFDIHIEGSENKQRLVGSMDPSTFSKLCWHILGYSLVHGGSRSHAAELFEEAWEEFPLSDDSIN